MFSPINSLAPTIAFDEAVGSGFEPALGGLHANDKTYEVLPLVTRRCPMIAQAITVLERFWDVLDEHAAGGAGDWSDEVTVEQQLTIVATRLGQVYALELV